MKNKNIFRISLLLMIVVFSLPLVGLLPSGFPETHDGRDHVARIANFYQSLSEGNLVPRWAGDLNWGYGHPILMFLYPFPSYVSSLFHFLGFNLVDSVKLFFALAYLFSGVFMYVWLRKEVRPIAALSGALLYNLAPYRFVDLYVRGAIGEHAAFIFFPLVMLGIFDLTNIERKIKPGDFLLLAISVCFLILSHNALSLMFLPVAALYAFFRLSKVEYHRSFVLSLLFSVLIGFGFAAFFWIPAFVEGKYTLRDIVTRGEFSVRFVSVFDFFRPVWNYGQADTLPKQLGLVQWLMVFVAAVLTFRNKIKTRRVIGWTLGVLFLTLVIQTKLATPLWEGFSLLQKFQFPWRFLSLSVFLVAVSGALAISEIENGLNQKKSTSLIFIGFLSFALIVTTYPMWRPKGSLFHPETFYTNPFPSTTDTGESSPIWSVRFMENFPAAPAEVISGEASIIELKRTSTRHLYRIEGSGARILENTLYFPNWQVYIDGQPITVEFQDPVYRGLLTFSVPAGKYEVLVQFKDTKVRQVANATSLFSLVLGFSISLYLWKRKSV